MTILRCAFASLASLVLASTPVLSATVSSAQGQVFADFGEGYVGVAPGQSLPPGTRVFVSMGGNANISFSGGCSAPVSAGSVMTVPASSPCGGAEQYQYDQAQPNVDQGWETQTTSAQQQQWAGQVATAPEGWTSQAPPPATAAGVGGGLGTTGLVVGGLAVAGGIAGLVALSSADEDDPPASP